MIRIETPATVSAGLCWRLLVRAVMQGSQHAPQPAAPGVAWPASLSCLLLLGPCQEYEHAQPATTLIVHAQLAGRRGTLQALQLHEAHPRWT